MTVLCISPKVEVGRLEKLGGSIGKNEQKDKQRGPRGILGGKSLRPVEECTKRCVETLNLTSGCTLFVVAGNISSVKEPLTRRAYYPKQTRAYDQTPVGRPTMGLI